MSRDGINRRAIEQFMGNIQREVDKHPIRVAVQAEEPVLRDGRPLGGTVYNGPVFYGDANGALLAWNNETVTQSQQQSRAEVAAGYETIAKAVVFVLENLHIAGLPEDAQQDAEEAANEVLTEVTQTEPDRRKIQRALTALKGCLASLAAGLTSGAAEGAQEWARTAIEQLGTPF